MKRTNKKINASTFADASILPGIAGEDMNPRNHDNVIQNGSRIARAFDISRWTPPLLWENDGQLYVLQGNSRHWAIKFARDNNTLADFGKLTLPVEIVSECSLSQALFLMLDHGASVGLTQLEIVRAVFVAFRSDSRREDGTSNRNPKTGLVELCSTAEEFLMRFSNLFADWGKPYLLPALPHKPSEVPDSATPEEREAWVKKTRLEFQTYLNKHGKNTEGVLTEQSKEDLDAVAKASNSAALFAVCSQIWDTRWKAVKKDFATAKIGRARVPLALASMVETGADHLYLPYLKAMNGEKTRFNFSTLFHGSGSQNGGVNILNALKADGTNFIEKGGKAEEFTVTPETAPNYFRTLKEIGYELDPEARAKDIEAGKDPDGPLADTVKTAEKPTVRTAKVLDEHINTVKTNFERAKQDGNTVLADHNETVLFVLEWARGIRSTFPA